MIDVCFVSGLLQVPGRSERTCGVVHTTPLRCSVGRRVPAQGHRRPLGASAQGAPMQRRMRACFAVPPEGTAAPAYGGTGGSGGSRSGSGGGGGGGGGASGRPNPLAALWALYLQNLAKRPLLTKMFTSLVGFGLGDVLAQHFLDKQKLDKKRLFRMMSFGFLIHGSTGHYWYQFLDQMIKGTGVREVVSKVALDQLLWAPIFTAIFLGYTSLLSGASTEETVKKIKADTFTGVRASWSVWPVAHAINFRFVPPSQRLLYINSIQIAYNMFLSILATSRPASVQVGPSKSGSSSGKTKVNDISGKK
jgi:protein Mpv17